MIKYIRKLSAVLLSTLMLLLSASTLLPLKYAEAAEQNEVTFAVIQDNRMSVLTELWEQPLQYISEKTGLKINFYATTSYASVVEAMMAGFVDFAKLGPKIYLVAAEKSQGTIVPIANFAAAPNAFNPNPCACYFGLLISKEGSKFDSIQSLQGSVLALTDPGSTSGNAVPRALFPGEIGGSTLENYFSSVFYSGSHDASTFAIVRGQADAAFVADGNVNRLIMRGEVKKEDLRVLWRSPEIPIDGIVVNTKTLTEENIEKIRKAFLEMHLDEAGRKGLKGLNYVQFLPATDASYDPLREILEAKKKLSGGD